MDDKMSKDRSLIPLERIERSILLVRGHKVMLNRDLAYLKDKEGLGFEDGSYCGLSGIR